MEERWYRNWGFNRAVLFTYLTEIVEQNGGSLVCEKGWSSYGKQYVIHNRSVDQMLHECIADITRIKSLRKSNDEAKMQARKEYLQKKEEALKWLEKASDRCIKTQMTSFIGFVFDGMYYHLDMDDNPLFPFHVTKVHIGDDLMVKYDHYSDEFVKDTWWDDVLYGYKMTDDDYKEFARRILNQLLATKESEIVFEKRRVPNMYNSGYHFERVPLLRVRQYERCEFSGYEWVSENECK